MDGKAKEKQRFCGNCGNHTTYTYPSKIFCSMRFCQNKDPVVETLWCCENWIPTSQECYCVEEASKRPE